MHRLVFVGVEAVILAASGIIGSGVVNLLQLQLQSIPVGTFDSLDLLLLKNSVAVPAVAAAYFPLQALASRFIPSVMRPLPAVVDSWAGARSRPSWGRVLFLVAAGFVVQAVVLTLNDLRDTHNGGEEPILLEMAMDRRPAGFAVLTVIGPIAEEVVFRIFLFARCARFMGVGPGLVVSSLLFGLVHWSPTADKVVPAAMAGAVFSGVYRLAQTPIAPCLMHMANNAVGVTTMGALSPLRPFDELAKALAFTSRKDAQMESGFAAAKRVICKAADSIGVLSGPNDPPVDADGYVNARVWLESDFCTLRPSAAALVDSLFDALDRGGKGFLSPAEFAYAESIKTGEFALFNAALGVLERHLGDDDPAIDTLRRHLEQAPSLAEPVPLPTSQFFTPQQRDHARAQIAAAHSLFPSLAQQLPTPRWQQLSPSGGLRSLAMQKRMVPASEEQPLPHPLQRQVFERYYAQAATASYKAHFQHSTAAAAPSANGGAASSGVCDRAAFSQLIRDNLVHRPTTTARWLAALAEVLQAQHEHPTAQLLDAHERGLRPGYRGVLVVRQAQK